VALLGVLLFAFPQFAQGQNTQDWGDAPTNYPTLGTQNGARHTATGPMLGTLRDTESNGQPNANATGDDVNPATADDEDGVTFLTLLVPGQSAQVQVVASAAGLLNAWLDFTDDGDWNDAGERIFNNTAVSAGTNLLSFNVPAAAVQGATFARFRIATANAPIDAPTGAASNGEVEDYIVAIGAPHDFGDAPSNLYPTLLAQNGARHLIVSNFFLGARIDAEPDGQPNANATGDDVLPTSGDDEDGIVFLTALTAGQSATVRVTATMATGQNGGLDAWIDFNADGDWADAGENIFSNVRIINGANNLVFAVPGSAVGRQTFARFRLSSKGGLTPVGTYQDGEVEDYQVNVTAALDFGDAPTNSYPTLLSQDGARHIFTNTFCLGRLVDGEVDGQPDLDAKGDDSNPAGSDDEDGVTFTSGIVPGGIATVEVFLTGSGPAGAPAGILNAWLDFNHDGDWGDSGDQIFNNQALVPGANSLTFAVPSFALQGTTYARFRLNRQGGLTFTRPATDGEVEDYRVNISGSLDYGDAPKPYPTVLAENGARHTVNPDVFLGSRIDSEPDGQPEPAALGDDLGGGPDEDGVTFTSPLIPGSMATVQVRASTAGLLHAWIDFNRNGSWGDPGEKVFNGTAVSGGFNNLSFNVPATAATGQTFARFRYTLQTALVDFVGLVQNGEVEDYRVSIIPDRERCDHDCEGREYWLTFPGNYDPDPDNRVQLSFCIHGTPGTLAAVTIPGLGFSTNVVIPATALARVSLPVAADLEDLNDAVTNKGIHVVASAEVGITAFNHADFTTDSYLALNTSVLGTDYIIVGYQNVHTGVPPLNGTQFAIVGVESNTVVGILPTVTTGIRTGGVPYFIVLQPGDTYQLRNTNDAPNDLSGTLVKSSKPIAVFGSHQNTVVPALTNKWFQNHLVEQLLPLNTWGNNFYTAPLATRSGGDTFRIMAGYDNTTVLLNGAFLVNLDRGKFHELLLAAGSRITANQPIFVAQYANSGDFDTPINQNADPFMMTVQATRHWTTGYRICTPPNDFPTNYVNVIAPSGAIAGILRDGVPIPGPFVPIDAFSSYARVLVTPGLHTFTGGAPFGVSVYGWAEYDSYGHPGCFYFGDVVGPTVSSPVGAGTTASVNDYPNTPGFAPAPSIVGGAVVEDNCDREPRPPTQTPPPGTLFPPGVHVLTLSSYDISGNIGETNVVFTVLDPSPVVIECPSNIVVNCVSNDGAVVTFNVLAKSTYDPNVPVVSTPPSGSLFPPGTTVVNSVATSLAGQSNSCSFTVTVACQGRITVTRGRNGLVFTWTGTPGTLEFAPSITGPWLPLATGVNTYVHQPGDKQEFFRVRH
jgi:hypothetical protein